MIFELHPPQAAGPLRIGAAGHDTVETLKQLGTPQVLCRTPGNRPAWAVHRASGLFIGACFDADDRLEAIEFGRPDGKDDTITYDGLDVFTRQRQASSTNCDSAPPSTRKKMGTLSPHPACSYPWRPVTPQAPGNQEGRFFESVLIARPGYYDQPAEPCAPSRE